ncbi:MAG: hypothetical protein JRI54_07555 [Deltaproteobacteria bacterium]|nr:hypothetical protein [Deltaproteobacteria bacterium]
MKLDHPKIKEIIRDRSLYMCLECGKCSASCPRMLTGKDRRTGRRGLYRELGLGVLDLRALRGTLSFWH